MGRIRPSFVKIRAIRLVNEYPGEFTPDFENNKVLVEKYTDGANNHITCFWEQASDRNKRYFKLT